MTYEVREDGVYVDDVRVYAQYQAGYLLFMGRADNEATANAIAKAVGLFVEVATEQGVTKLVTHKNISWVTEKDGIPKPILVPAVLNEEGEVVTPAQYDPRFHFNFRLNPVAIAGGEWEAWAKDWSLDGEDAEPNKNEIAKKRVGIELIDRDWET